MSHVDLLPILVELEHLGAASIVLLVREDYKFIHSRADPAQLYHLLSDPGELRSLAQAPATPACCTASAQAAKLGDIIASQSWRHLIRQALGCAYSRF